MDRELYRPASYNIRSAAQYRRAAPSCGKYVRHKRRYFSLHESHPRTEVLAPNTSELNGSSRTTEQRLTSAVVVVSARRASRFLAVCLGINLIVAENRFHSKIGTWRLSILHAIGTLVGYL